MINVEVERGATENPTSLIKRFTKRVQGAGVLVRVRGIRYSKRKESPYVRQKRTLKSIRRRTEHDRMVRLGKIEEVTRR